MGKKKMTVHKECCICLKEYDMKGKSKNRKKALKKAEKKAWEKGHCCNRYRYWWGNAGRCKKWFCKHCVQHYLVKYGKFLTCIDCGFEMQEWNVRRLTKKKDWEMYRQRLAIKAIRGMSDTVACTAVDCPMYYWVPKKKCVRGTCIYCPKMKWCLMCGEIWKK